MQAGKGLSDFPVPFEGVFLFDGVATTASDPIVMIMICCVLMLIIIQDERCVDRGRITWAKMYTLHRKSKTKNQKRSLCNGVDSAR